MIKIIVKEENKPSRDFEVEKFPVSIGRSKDNTIRIPSPFLSREHCRIEKTKKGYRVVDLDSKNGLSVNGQSVKASDLSSRDMITIGNNTFTLVIDGKKEAFKEGERPSAAKAVKAPGKAVDDSVWEQQLVKEDVAECDHCGIFYSIAFEIPGLGAFCPNCKTKHEGSRDTI